MRCVVHAPGRRARDRCEARPQTHLHLLISLSRDGWRAGECSTCPGLCSRTVELCYCCFQRGRHTMRGASLWGRPPMGGDRGDGIPSSSLTGCLTDCAAASLGSWAAPWQANGSSFKPNPLVALDICLDVVCVFGYLCVCFCCCLGYLGVCYPIYVPFPGAII